MARYMGAGATIGIIVAIVVLVCIVGMAVMRPAVAAGRSGRVDPSVNLPQPRRVPGPRQSWSRSQRQRQRRSRE